MRQPSKPRSPQVSEVVEVDIVVPEVALLEDDEGGDERGAGAAGGRSLR
ncbi:hypothetical protein [Streptomyces sp. NPDC007083]